MMNRIKTVSSAVFLEIVVVIVTARALAFDLQWRFELTDNDWAVTSYCDGWNEGWESPEDCYWYSDGCWECYGKPL